MRRPVEVPRHAARIELHQWLHAAGAGRSHWQEDLRLLEAEASELPEDERDTFWRHGGLPRQQGQR